MNIFSVFSVSRVSRLTVQAQEALYENDLLKLTDDSMGGRLVFGLQVAAIGLAIVFAVLISLWLILVLSGNIFQNLSKKAEAAAKAQEVIPEPEPVAAAVEVAEGDGEEDEEELISVLTAAIAASMEIEEEPITGFRVVSFKKREVWKNGG